MAETRATAADPAARERLRSLVNGYRASLALNAAAALGIADVVAESDAASAASIATRTSTDSPSMARFLRLLVALGVLEEEGGRYSLTPMGTLLRRDTPGSMRDAILFSTDVETHSWSRLADGLRTGTTPFVIAYGRSVFDYLAQPEHADLARRFDGFMSGLTAMQARALIAAYDFSRHAVVADIGGGDGSLLSAILGAHPRVRGILFDLPHVARAAEAKLDAAGLGERVRVVGGSFFDEVPGGGDVYVMKFILHDWDDERCLRILERCRRAMASDARLVLFERIIPDRHADPAGFTETVLADMHMFVNPGGQERTLAEWTDLLARGGFTLERTIATDVPPKVIEARVSS